MNKTSIQWTDYSSNPLRAYHTETGKRGWFCTHASPGCESCYAERLNLRLGNGLTYIAPNRKHVRFELHEPELEQWQRLKPGERVFPFDMCDLFHEDVSDEILRRVFRAMWDSSGTFQVLTKRADRLRDFAGWWFMQHTDPLPNAWLGVSVEDQRRADERIPLLLETPAALRFLSVEPLLGPIEFSDVTRRSDAVQQLGKPALAGIGWVIVGGESGPRARPCNVAWIRSVVQQCQAAGVPVFVKQMGRWIGGDHAGFLPHRWLLADGSGWVPPVIGPRAKERPEGAAAFGLGDPKGGKLEEWPADLQIREMPG